MKSWFTFFLLLLSVSFIAAQNTVVNVIVNSADHTILEAAVLAAELDDDLSGAGPFTVFAPTDAAFAALPAGTVEALLEDPTGDLANILLHHVVSGDVRSTDLSDNQVVTTLLGKNVVVTVSAAGVFINNAQVTVADIVADNGVVHVIDAVLLPSNTVVDVILESEVHTTLEVAVLAAELDDDLSGAGPFTVFAPTDAAFAALPAGTVEALLEDPTGDLANILLHHVVSGDVRSTDLSDNQVVTTLLGKNVVVTVSSAGVFINNAQVTVADVVADNGVVHVIDAVLLPSNTVVDVILESEVHTTLEAAVLAAELDDDLSGAGPFTVFAPTDAAFAALPAGTVEALLEDPTGDLANILLHHVVSGDVRSTDLSDNQVVTTLLGKNVVVTVSSAGVFINNAQVTVADVVADNGVVHVIDAVLLPSNTVVDVILESEVHTTLEAAVLAAELDDDLSGAGPFTVFAPTDAAFAALPAGTVEALLEDPTGDLANILLHHVVSGDVRSTDLSDNQVVTTLLGKNVVVTVSSAGVFINNAQVTVADVVADNGVVHVIDAVLLPSNTVVDVILESEVHTTLEAAVLAAELDDDLSGAGPFTVFAPTDAAFAALPAGTVEALLEDPTGDLANILLHHVVSGDVRSTDLSDNQVVTTLLGKNVVVTVSSAGVFINNAQVTVADVVADNGVVHVIDAVLLPSNTVVDVILESEVHTTLEAAVLAAELDDDLSGAGPFTVFAPTDAAFAALPAGTVEALLEDPTGDLANILLHHVVSGDVRSTDLSDNQVVTTLLGKNVVVTVGSAGVFINNAQVTVADIVADNGVVHVIDAVLLPSNTVVDVILESEVHTTLEAAVLAAELDDDLSGAGPFTVFAPTDAAFAALPAGTVEALLEDPTGDLANILLHHVVSGDVRSTDLSDNQVVTTLLGKNVVVTVGSAGVFINNAQVTVADVVADNGVVHVIDAVLLPSNTVVDVILESEVHTTLEAAVLAAELDDDLSGAGPFTVFAPTDAAFAALPAGTVEALLEDPTGDLANILLHHVVSGDVRSTDLSDNQVVTTLLGKNVVVTVGSAGVFINNAQVTVADIVADNGVVHVIDAVLLPSNTVVDVILESEVHTTLEAAVLAAELDDDLSGAGPFTVFAPTDAAFAALPAGTVEALLEDPTGDLANILLHHVVSGDVRSTDLSDNQVVTTLLGKNVVVTVGSAGVFINNAQVTVADVVADNGVVHVIDAVLLPSNTVVDVILESEVHKTLEAAVLAAELDDDLSGAGPFTVFAPTDAAFAALPAGTVEALLEDPTGDLATILLYHVLGLEVKSTELSDQQVATTLQGETILVTINAEGVLINNAKVVVADIEADNGVVHVIDAVLLPQSITNVEDVSTSVFNIKVFPNPVVDQLNINILDESIDKAKVMLWNIDGKLVRQWNWPQGSYQVDVTNLPAGNYFLEFRTNKGILQQQVVITK
ncbi:MAG: fasciclin domain-containing protein [Saprospiraceae bacterium]